MPRKRPQFEKPMPLLPLHLQTPECVEAWQLWLDHKCDKRQLTQRAMVIQLNDIERENWTPEQVTAYIRHSVKSGWSSINPDPAFKAQKQSCTPNADALHDAVKGAYAADPAYWQHCGYDYDLASAVSHIAHLPAALQRETRAWAAQRRIRI